MSITFGSTRLLKPFAHLLFCIALTAGLTACGGVRQTTPSPSSSPEPAYVTEEVLCDAIPNDLLGDQLSLKVKFYHCKHFSNVDQNGATVSYFECRLYGDQSTPQGAFGLQIGYAPYGHLRANPLSNAEFSSLDEMGLDETTFEGIDGRGYVWLGGGNTSLNAAWLFPDDQTLEINLYHYDSTKNIYSEDDLEGMRVVLKELITTIPLVAAGPAQQPTEVHPDPNGKTDHEQATPTF